MHGSEHYQVRYGDNELDSARPSPVVEFGDDILNPEFAVGNDSPSTQPFEPVVKMSSETSPTISPL